MENDSLSKTLCIETRNGRTSITFCRSHVRKSHIHLTQEQQELIALKGLTLSANVALTDVNVAEQSLDTVRTQWEQFHQELGGVVSKIEKATNADMIIVQKAWFNGACKEWALVIKDAQDTASLAA